MIKKAAVALVLTTTLTAALMTSGCLLAAAGAAAGGGVLYAKGDLEANLEATPPRIATATEKAFKELRIIKTSIASSALDAEILGRTATDKPVAVRCTAQTAKLSAISIRVGAIGDETLSQLILDKIRKNL